MNAKIAVGLVHLFCDNMAKRFGVSKTRCLSAVGLDDAEQLDDPEHRVDLAVLIALFRFAQLHTREPGLGLQLAQPLDLRQQGFWGYALLSSSTLRERVDGHLRYQPLRSPLSLTLTEQAGMATLDIAPRGIPADVLVSFMDWAVATSLHQLRSQLGHALREAQLWLSYAEQPHHRDLTALFEGRIVWNAPCLRLSFPASLLERRLAGDPYLGRLARAQLDQQLQHLPTCDADAPAELIERVRERVAARMHDDASLARIARDLGVGARTLQRQLDSQGAAFNDLLEDVRRLHALQCVTQTAQSVQQIAASLGYADASSFRRAFRRWTGRSPAGYRAALRAAPCANERIVPLTRDVRGTARNVPVTRLRRHSG